jgi:hypothetical protein
MESTARAELQRTLDEPRVRSLLERLHAEAWGGGQLLPFARFFAEQGLDSLLGRTPTVREEVERARDIYMCLGPDQGRLAYLLARTIDARRIVEFGTSFGVSTIYFAAAVRDNGGGIVIGSELEPSKAARARVHLEQAGSRRSRRPARGRRAQDAGRPGRHGRSGAARRVEGALHPGVRDARAASA